MQYKPETCKDQTNEKLCKKRQKMVFAELLIGRLSETKLKSDVPEIQMRNWEKEKREKEKMIKEGKYEKTSEG